MGRGLDLVQPAWRPGAGGRCDEEAGKPAQRFAAATLSKLDYEDWFESQFNSPFAADPELVARIENSILEDAKRPARERIESFFGNPNERTPRTVEIIGGLVPSRSTVDGNHNRTSQSQARQN